MSIWWGMQASVDLYVCKRKKERKRQEGRAWALGYHSGGERAAAAACSEVSGGLGGEGLDAAGVTVFAEDVSVQRVASLVIALRQQGATVLQDRDAALVHKHESWATPTDQARSHFKWDIYCQCHTTGDCLQESLFWFHISWWVWTGTDWLLMSVSQTKDPFVFKTLKPKFKVLNVFLWKCLYQQQIISLIIKILLLFYQCEDKYISDCLSVNRWSRLKYLTSLFIDQQVHICSFAYLLRTFWTDCHDVWRRRSRLANDYCAHPYIFILRHCELKQYSPVLWFIYKNLQKTCKEHFHQPQLYFVLTN